jgi:hypothetical protein
MRDTAIQAEIRRIQREARWTPGGFLIDGITLDDDEAESVGLIPLEQSTSLNAAMAYARSAAKYDSDTFPPGSAADWSDLPIAWNKSHLSHLIGSRRSHHEGRGDFK